MKLTMLVENSSINERVGAEHGLSLYIEANGVRLLFDMGQTALFAKNAAALGVDLTAVDTAVLSHGHYDHGGGLSRFLSVNDKAPVYISRFAFEPHYNGTEKYIGLDMTLEGYPRLITVGDETVIGEGLTIYSCNQLPQAYKLGSFGLTVKEGDGFLPDDFRHEHYLLIEENGKRVLISGCSHKGILNVAQWFKPHVLIGGFHFSKLPLDDTLADYAAILDSFDTMYYTCHCTGAEQYSFMKARMKRLRYLAGGQTITI